MLTRARNTVYNAIEIAPAKLAVAAGLRAAIATVVPLVVGLIFGFPHTSWAALGGFLTALGDKGGDYRTRAFGTAALALVCALTTIVGGWMAVTVWTAVIGMFIWATMGSMLRVFGAVATTIGVAAAIVFADSLAVPVSSWGESFSRAAAVLVGGAWSITLSLFLWPIQYYRPARRAVAHVYELLAAHAESMVKFGSGQDRQAPRKGGPSQRTVRQNIFLDNPAAIRDGLEQARQTLTGTRRGRAGETPRGERLLVALEGADQMFAILMAIADQLDILLRDGPVDIDTDEFQPVYRGVLRALGDYQKTALETVRVIGIEDGEPDPPPVTWGGEVVKSELSKISPDGVGTAVVRARYEHLAVLLAQLREYTHIVAVNVSALNTRRSVDESVIPARSSGAFIPEPSWRERLRDALSTDAVAFPHALRVGVTAAVAVLLSSWWNLDHAYWVTLTVIVILQPYLSATMLKGLQRMGGTVLGGMAAAVLASVFHNPYAMFVVVFCLAAIGVSIMSVNYGLYSAVIACTFILLTEVDAPDTHLVQVRILNTLLGGALALIGAYALWPRRERAIFPHQMAKALRASQQHVSAVFARVLHANLGAEEQYWQARREVGMAIMNAEASFQRLLSESEDVTEMESAMALVTYIRRFNTAITGFGSVPWDEAPEQWRAVLQEGEPMVERDLQALADAVEHRESPPQFPRLPVLRDHEASVDGIPQLVYRMQLERVARQLRVLHSAVLRYTTPSASIAFTSEMTLPGRYPMNALQRPINRPG